MRTVLAIAVTFVWLFTLLSLPIGGVDVVKGKADFTTFLIAFNFLMMSWWMVEAWQWRNRGN